MKMYMLVMVNKYRKKKKFKSFEIYTWAKTKKELKDNLGKTTKLFLKMLKTKNIPKELMNYGIMKDEYPEKLLGRIKTKSQTFPVGD